MKTNVPKKSILQDYMRDAYEEFSELLLSEIQRQSPQGHKTVKTVKSALKKVIEDHFGKDPGGDIFFD